MQTIFHIYTLYQPETPISAKWSKARGLLLVEGTNISRMARGLLLVEGTIISAGWPKPRELLLAEGTNIGCNIKWYALSYLSHT